MLVEKKLKEAVQAVEAELKRLDNEVDRLNKATALMAEEVISATERTARDCIGLIEVNQKHSDPCAGIRAIRIRFQLPEKD